MPPVLAMSEVAMGVQHSCGVGRFDGQIYCWGDDTFGQSSPPSAAVAAAAHAVVDDSSLFPAAETVFHGLSLGYQHSCALDQSGHAHCWYVEACSLCVCVCVCYMCVCNRGNAGNGRTTPPDASTTFSSLTSGFHHTCGVRRSNGASGAGTVVCWGSNTDGQVRKCCYSKFAFHSNSF